MTTRCRPWNFQTVAVEPNVPEGFSKVGTAEVYVRGEDIIILGIPNDEADFEDGGHNCDFMGCGGPMGDHVVIVGKVLKS